MSMSNIKWPEAGCCFPDWPNGCVCPPMEKALRGWKRLDPFMPTMTAEQREACLGEIGQVEGHSRALHEQDSDADLAAAVLDAWTDYARDKGLL